MNRPPTLVILGLLMVALPASAQPAKMNAELEKAEAAFRAGKTQEAFALLQECVKKAPHLPPASLQMARFHFAAGQSAPGRACLEQAAIEAPQHPEVFLTNASQALAEGRFTETILNCHSALEYAAADRWTADQKKSFQKEARLGLAAASEARQDWESTRTHLRAVLEIEPKNARARHRLARAMLSLGQESEALHELQQASRDDPTLPPAEAEMGTLFSARGNGKQAEIWFQKAVQLHPQDAQVHRAYGSWLLARGRLDAATIHINLAASRDPKSRATRSLQGMLARFAKNHESAIKIFEELMREEPGNFDASNQWTLTCLELADRRGRAVQQAELNARLYPRLAEALATLGWAYLKMDRIDEAEKALAASVSGGPISPDTAYYLARLLKEKARNSDARDILKKALDSDGPFVNRHEAQALWNELQPAKEKKN